MAAQQFKSLVAIYVESQADNRMLAKLTQAAQTVDCCDGTVPENTRPWVRTMDGWSTETEVDDTFMLSLAKHTTSVELLDKIRRGCNEASTPITT